MEFILMLINLLPILGVGYLSTALTVCSCNYKSKGVKYVLISVAFKYFVGNTLGIYCVITQTEVDSISIFDAVFVIATCLIYRIFLSDSWDKLLFVSIISDCRSLICMQGAIAAVSYIWHYNLLDYSFELPTKYNLIVISFGVVFLILTQMIGRNLYLYIREKQLKYPKLWKTLLIIYCIIGVYVSGGLKFFFYHKSIVVATIAMIFVVFILREKKKQLLEMSNNYLLLQQNMILQYYESLKEQIELTKKMLHDINNHMQIMESIRKEYEGKELASYANDLREQYERLEPVYYCDNVVINALLSNKSKKCKKEGISFEANMREFDMGNLTEYDLAGILFNLLDNAIESCQKIPDKEKRYICLNCFSNAGQLLIHVENNCMEQETSDKDKVRFFTSKPDKKRHGIGMGIIEDTAKKYGGGMEVKHRECRFEVVVNIPEH